MIRNPLSSLTNMTWVQVGRKCYVLIKLEICLEFKNLGACAWALAELNLCLRRFQKYRQKLQHHCNVTVPVESIYLSNFCRPLLRLVVYANLWRFWKKIAVWLIQMMCRAELEAALKSDIKTDPKLSQEQLPQPSSFAIALANSLPFIGMGAVDNAIMVRIRTSASLWLYALI